MCKTIKKRHLNLALHGILQGQSSGKLVHVMHMCNINQIRCIWDFLKLLKMEKKKIQLSFFCLSIIEFANSPDFGEALTHNESILLSVLGII